jgi:murein L,D-transpeptidase YafK
LNPRRFVRPLLASAAIAAALLLAGCDTDNPSPSLRSLQPLSASMVAEIERQNMSKESPILVRLFKEESELEVWKEDRNGDFTLLKTYPICRWSGELGPKIKEGDRQAPEGFYTITPGLMNPNSSYYLAINMGFPNKYDQANGRTGNFLMIHGDCSSRGCYAMTDEQIAEIYALARESFFGGQRTFQIQAYPFRMTALNMAKHRNSPHMAFWKMLKQGNDHFEVSKREPRVDVCEKRYVFDAETNSKFSPADACPPYQVGQELTAAVAEKTRRDERQMAEYINKGTPTVPVVTRTDGGMHPKFLAAFQKPDASGAAIRSSAAVSTPGTIPAHASPPREPEPATGSFGLASANTRVASAGDGGSSGNWFGGLFTSNSPEQPSSSDGVFDRMSRFVGLKGSEPAPDAATAQQKKKSTPTKSTQTAAATPKAPTPKATSTTSTSPATAPTNAGAIRPAAPKAQEAKPEPKPEASQEAKAPAAPEPRPASSAGVLNGTQPATSGGSFNSRWGSFSN